MGTHLLLVFQFVQNAKQVVTVSKANKILVVPILSQTEVHHLVKMLLLVLIKT